jgi:hypothetical protein
MEYEMKKCLMVAIVIVAGLIATTRGYSQHWSLGGNMGLSLLGGSPGFHFTPTAELLLNRNVAVGSEFSVNTQYGAPLIWHPYFKYYIGIHGSQLKPHASAGPVLAFNVPNGPCFGLLFGGGVNIPVANRLYLTPNVLLGPVFGYGGGQYPFIVTGVYWEYTTYGLTSYTIPSRTIFAFSIRGGIRYEI